MTHSRDAAVEQLHAATALYTTTPVVEKLLDRVGWWKSGQRLLDPSCGDGSFLVAALERVPLPPDDIMTAAHRVQGWEIHPGAVEQARQRIINCLRVHGWQRASAHAAALEIVKARDTLLWPPTVSPFNVIVGNPPFLRASRWPAYFKHEYDGRLPAYAGADLLHAFLTWCTLLLPDDGVIGMVCSDRVLFNENAAGLRAELGKRVFLEHTARLDPTSSFYREKLRVAGSPPRIHPVEVVLRSRHARALAPGWRELTVAPIYPEESGSEFGQSFGQNARMPEESGRTLADVATVRIAPWLGPVGLFVVDRGKNLSNAHRVPVLIPAVDTDDIRAGDTVVRHFSRLAILTEPGTPPPADVRRHLLKMRRRLKKAGKLPARMQQRKWWLPAERITLPLDQPMLMVPRIAKRLRVVELPAGVLPINHNLSVVCTNGGPTLQELRELLLREESQAWIQRHAPRLEDGYYSITTKLLRRLPV